MRSITLYYTSLYNIRSWSSFGTSSSGSPASCRRGLKRCHVALWLYSFIDNNSSNNNNNNMNKSNNNNNKNHNSRGGRQSGLGCRSTTKTTSKTATATSMTATTATTSAPASRVVVAAVSGLGLRVVVLRVFVNRRNCM